MLSASDYEELIRPIQSRMAGTVWRVLRTADGAEDALQDTLTTVWQQWSRIQRHPNPQALILKICADCACDQLRRQSRRREQVDVDVLADSLVSSEPGPAERLGIAETLEEVMEAIRDLSQNQAVAIVMRFVQQESYEDIAAALGCGEATARKHVARGRGRLQQLLPHLVSSDTDDSQIVGELDVNTD